MGTPSLVRRRGRRQGGWDRYAEAAVAAAVNKAAATNGAINILFNNTGGSAPGHFPNVPFEEFNRIIRLNLMGTFYISQAVWPHLIETGGGAVINMSSIAAQRGMSPVMYEEFGATTSAYWTSKAGVETLTRYMAGIGGKHNIRVNCVRPGQIMTRGATGEKGWMTKEWVRIKND